ncbi:DUF6146 family protein [Zobellia galactanivorans]|uniref:Conserved hypothetical lipoprotein n=1 Tax=Zobellia galactanivorans (strain DSM 12802 / CCUG 47099 / CIP 106680 / NCIMB 13871 / Dsij) TaxID=63186 RepID=G0L7S4_ZOBGA|nr:MULTISPECIES: DUF6146 family protein [Zobellia]MBU3025058.1 hypothetical protein [Zobellia galactanivorans]MDO6808642.1 DUF6146 family protein [Zobellia galactanivorans]OWW25625.1 hypothetical protein B4Q04_08425 [Zobellia sp. OII3]CAZ98248.1 Conserved hypothetical lipoprotein [Zobellia galactanivorans]
MKKIYLVLGTLGLFFVMIAGSCSSSKETVISDKEKAAFRQKEADTVKIADDATEYEIIIIEPGFNFWLESIAKPRNYYSQEFLESRNQIFVTNYNQRVMQPMRYDPNLYEQQINYDFHTDYGYEVNYKLYNYFIYFQRKYNQRLGPFVPRI